MRSNYVVWFLGYEESCYYIGDTNVVLTDYFILGPRYRWVELRDFIVEQYPAIDRYDRICCYA